MIIIGENRAGETVILMRGYFPPFEWHRAGFEGIGFTNVREVEAL